MTDLAAADAAARERALDVTRSFVVQAPAGSGKTTVLTQRYLKLLTQVDEPEQVLAITFTRKAAGEMRERVRQALDGSAAAKSSADVLTLDLARQVRVHAARLGWGIDESAARLRIQTIDSFNTFLAHSLPITSRRGLSRGVAEEPDDLYALAARETMRGAETDPALREHFERVMRRLDDSWGRAEALIAEMFKRRSEWLPNLPQLSGEDLAQRVEESLRVLVGEEFVRFTSLLSADFVEQGSAFARCVSPWIDPGKLPAVAAWVDRTGPLTAELGDLRRWQGIADLSLTDKNLPRKRFTKNEGVRPEDPHAKRLCEAWRETLQSLGDSQIAALAALRELPEPRIPQRERKALDSLAHLLLAAAAQLKVTFNAFGECDFPEIASAAREALHVDSSPTPLAERLDARIAHILIDEFQDTSRDQYELLLTLTQEWMPGDGRTLFLVGDPMQSIYGFRNAEVGRFSAVRDGGLGQITLEPLELRRNFRSAPPLVHWFNETFASVFPREDDARSSAVRHLASVAAREGMAGESHLRRVTGEDCAADEALDVVMRIEELRRAHPAESIAVLGGVRPHLRTVRRLLAERGVPFIGVKLEPLVDVPVVRDLEALARALDSPLDRIAWLAVLRAPCVGLTLPDLTAVAMAAGNGSVLAALLTGVPGVSPDGRERLVRAMDVLVRAWSDRELEPRAHRIERAWLALHGAAACPQNQLPHARRFLLKLDTEEQLRQRGREPDLESLLSKLYADDPAKPGAVALMTIHGAKGLEFDHVFVVGVGRKPRPDDPKLLNWLELPRPRDRDLLLMAPIRNSGVEGDGDGDDEPSETPSIDGYVRKLVGRRIVAERARQAYVALTRAKRTLHVYVHPRVNEKEGAITFSPHAHSLLHTLWPAIGAGIADLEGVGGTHAVAVAGEVEAAATQLRRRLPARLPAAVAPPEVVSRGEILQAGVEEEEIVFDWARQSARRIGTVVHEELERLARGALPALESPKLAGRLESRLRTLGLDSEGARDGAQRALAALRATLADDRGRWLFDPRHRDAHSELALTGLHGGRVINAVIDRIFIDETGTRWVVDFKSSPHEGANLAAFLSAQASRYTPQLERYVALARGLGPEPVRAGLYFPLLGAWREVSVA
jgi:ATP-dependent helicase/nuclease subunit A